MIAVLASAAGSAVAVEPNSENANVLGGPAVVDASGPDSGDTMSGSKGKVRATGDLPFRAYMGAIRGLAKAAQNNPELALTDEQKEELKAIGKAHKEKMKAFMEEHKEEIAELRGKRGEHGKRGQKGQRGKKADQGDTQQSESDARSGQQRQGAGEHTERGEMGDRPSPELRQKMRERMAELMATAPSDQEAKKQLWAVLTPAQQDAVKENIKTMRAKRQTKAKERIRPSGQLENENKAKQKEKRPGQKGLRRAKQTESNGDD